MLTRVLIAVCCAALPCVEVIDSPKSAGNSEAESKAEWRLDPPQVTKLGEWKGRWSGRLSARGTHGVATTVIDELPTLLVVSDDFERLAITRPIGSRVAVEFLGELGPEFDQIMPDPGLLLDPTGHSLAYVGRRGDRVMVVLDGHEGPDLVRVLNESMQFDSGGKRFGYIGIVEAEDATQRHAVIVDQEVVAQMEWCADLRFMPDGRWIVRGTTGRDKDGKREHSVLVEGEHVGSGIEFSVSPDGRYVVLDQQEPGTRLLIEGEVPIHAAATLPIFNRDGSHFVYLTQSANTVNGRRALLMMHRGEALLHAPVDVNGPNSNICVSDEGNVAFVTKAGRGFAVATEAGIGSEYQVIHHVCYPPGAIEPTYVASTGKRIFLCRPGGQEALALGRIQQVLTHPSGTFVAIVDGDDGRGIRDIADSSGIITEDGVFTLPGSVHISSPAMSEDGIHFACLVANLASDVSPELEGTWIYLDGQPLTQIGDRHVGHRGRTSIMFAEERLGKGGAPGTFWLYKPPSSRSRSAPSEVRFYRDGEVAHSFADPEIGPVCTSPDGMHLACWLGSHRNEPLSTFALNGVPVQTSYPPITRPSISRRPKLQSPSNRPFTGYVSNEGHFVYLSSMDGAIYRVRYDATRLP